MKESKKPRGGARPGAGMPKGKVCKKTLDKEVVRELVRQRVSAEIGPMLDSQISNAKGIKYLVVRQKSSGKFLRVTEAMAKAKAGNDEEIIEVWEKYPSVQAFSELLNRAIDKPKEQLQEVKLSGSVELIQMLHAGRERAAKAKKQA